MAVTLAADHRDQHGLDDRDRQRQQQGAGGPGQRHHRRPHPLSPASGATTTSLSSGAGQLRIPARCSSTAPNFRVTAVTPATAAAMGMTGAAFALNRWNFPSLATYSAAASRQRQRDLSSYNSPTPASPSPCRRRPRSPMGWIDGRSPATTRKIDDGPGQRHLGRPDPRAGRAAASRRPRSASRAGRITSFWRCNSTARISASSR